ncbi:hypothetical protein [Maricaulis sp.]|uniref:hypothetical protein n=1 Tax=Maricaulis sp. TaxID=1486257 RepID=UPI0025C2D8DB|nr:hypothetical protein [Maricaulis sp.]
MSIWIAPLLEALFTLVLFALCVLNGWELYRDFRDDHRKRQVYLTELREVRGLGQQHPHRRCRSLFCNRPLILIDQDEWQCEKGHGMTLSDAGPRRKGLV